MKKLFLITAAIMILNQLHNTSNAQNLVPNLSFEQYDTCPYDENQVPFATGWKYIYSNPISNSPDYFNACSPSIYVSVPYNVGGFQNAATGNAYCGFFTYGYREFIGTQLNSPLTIGFKYNVSFKVNMAFDDSTFHNYGATDKLGMLFSTIQYDTIKPVPVNNFAHVYTDTIITDTLNWIIISGSFIADSTYQYIVIGNFFDDANTDTLLAYQNVWGSSTKVDFAYYFVDDIYVLADSLNGISYGPDKEITIKLFPNPCTDQVSIKSSQNNINKIEIYNLLCILMFSESVYEKKDISVDIGNLKNGIYLVKIYSKQSVITRTLSINH